MSSPTKDVSVRTPVVVDDEVLAQAFALLRANEIDRLVAIRGVAPVRMRGYEMRVEDAEDVLAGVAVEVVRAARGGKITASDEETELEAAHRRMRLPVGRRVIDSFRARRAREQVEVLCDVPRNEDLHATPTELEFVDAVDALGAIPVTQAALLYESIVLGTPDADLARRDGVTPAAIRQRRRRILADLHARLALDKRATDAAEAA